MGGHCSNQASSAVVCYFGYGFIEQVNKVQAVRRCGQRVCLLALSREQTCCKKQLRLACAESGRSLRLVVQIETRVVRPRP